MWQCFEAEVTCNPLDDVLNIYMHRHFLDTSDRDNRWPVAEMLEKKGQFVLDKIYWYIKEDYYTYIMLTKSTQSLFLLTC